MAPSAVGEAMEVAGQSMTSAVLFQYFSLLSFVAGELDFFEYLVLISRC